MKKVRILIEKWSNQDVVEMSDEEYEEFIVMDILEQEDFLNNNYPSVTNYFDTVSIDINIVE